MTEKRVRDISEEYDGPTFDVGLYAGDELIGYSPDLYHTAAEAEAAMAALGDESFYSAL